MDAFIVHGGLGTTVEALRMKQPVAVTGVLLMDQRFWGGVCLAKGVGPAPVHFDTFRSSGLCVEFADKALDPDSVWSINARALDFGAEADDGVAPNARHFAALLNAGVAPVVSRSAWEAAASTDRDIGTQPSAPPPSERAPPSARKPIAPPPAGIDPGASIGGEGWSSHANPRDQHILRKSGYFPAAPTATMSAPALVEQGGDEEEDDDMMSDREEPTDYTIKFQGLHAEMHGGVRTQIM
jgi:hypothetical protein